MRRTMARWLPLLVLHLLGLAAASQYEGVLPYDVSLFETCGLAPPGTPDVYSFVMNIVAACGACCDEAIPADAPADDNVSAQVMSTIDDAGNTDSELERLELLRGLTDVVANGTVLKSDLLTLLPVVERFANSTSFWALGESGGASNAGAGESGFLTGSHVDEVWPDLLVTFGVSVNSYPPRLTQGANSPFYEIWAFYRARLLIWCAVEMAIVPEYFYDEARSLLETVTARFPHCSVASAYLGNRSAWADPNPTDANAPSWANHMRADLEKLDQVRAARGLSLD